MTQTPPIQPPSPTARVRDDDDCRCLCGNLLARWVQDGVELKCRRCKRTLCVPFSSIARGELRPASLTPVGEAG